MIGNNPIQSEVNNPSVDIDKLVRALQDPRWEVRRDAAQKLGELRCAKATSNLAAAIEDSMLEIREAAIQALGKIGAEASRAVPALVKALRDRKVSYEAAMALGAMGSAAKEAIPALVRKLEIPLSGSYDFPTINAIITALRLIGPDARLIPKLVSLVHMHSHDFDDIYLKRDSVGVWTSAIALLGDIGHPAVPALIEILREHLPRLWRSWGDEDKGIAMHVANVLGRLKADKAVPIFVDMLRAKHHFAFFDFDTWYMPLDDVRITAANLLGAMGPSARKAVPVLTRMLEDDSPEVRKAAATTLERIIGTSRI